MARRASASALVQLLLSGVPSVAACAAGAGCRHGEPPGALGVDASVAPLPSPASPASPAGPGADAPQASASPEAIGTALEPATLPQTKDRPTGGGVAFDARVAALWEAIAKDDPDRAIAFFFPLPAYEQVKAISNAGSDWKRRLVAAYRRDVHALHKRLGARAADAKLLRAEVPQERARWVEPNEESNKLGYYRVYGTRLVYDLDGAERSFEVTSLISWRGEWYVVHLTGFK